MPRLLHELAVGRGDGSNARLLASSIPSPVGSGVPSWGPGPVREQSPESVRPRVLDDESSPTGPVRPSRPPRASAARGRSSSSVVDLVLPPSELEGCRLVRCWSTRSGTSSGCISIHPTMPWCCASTKSPRSRPSTAPPGCCRCSPGRPTGAGTIRRRQGTTSLFCAARRQDWDGQRRDAPSASCRRVPPTARSPIVNARRPAAAGRHLTPRPARWMTPPSAVRAHSAVPTRAGRVKVRPAQNRYRARRAGRVVRPQRTSRIR